MSNRPTPKITINGIQLSYTERLSNCTNPQAPILLLHGLIATTETFAALIAHLPEDRRIIALNLPGTPILGTNPDVSFAGLAQLVYSFSQQLNLRHPIILGHSHGGAITLQLASSFPAFASDLILLCPAHPFLLRERALVAFYLSAPGRAVAHALPWLPRFLQLLGFQRMLGPVGRRSVIDFDSYREHLSAPGTIGAVLCVLATWSHDMDRLGTDLANRPIEVPTLILWGARDIVVPVETAPALERHLTQCEQRTLKGVGHLPNEEAPEVCANLISEWLVSLLKAANRDTASQEIA